MCLLVLSISRAVNGGMQSIPTPLVLTLPDFYSAFVFQSFTTAPLAVRLLRLLGICRLERHPRLLSRLLEGNAEFEELHDDIAEVFKEEVVVFGVLFNPWSHLLILDERHVGRQHH